MLCVITDINHGISIELLSELSINPFMFGENLERDNRKEVWEKIWVEKKGGIWQGNEIRNDFYVKFHAINLIALHEIKIEKIIEKCSIWKENLIFR